VGSVLLRKVDHAEVQEPIADPFLAELEKEHGKLTISKYVDVSGFVGCLFIIWTWSYSFVAPLTERRPLAVFRNLGWRLDCPRELKKRL